MPAMPPKPLKRPVCNAATGRCTTCCTGNSPFGVVAATTRGGCLFPIQKLSDSISIGFKKTCRAIKSESVLSQIKRALSRWESKPPHGCLSINAKWGRMTGTPRECADWSMRQQRVLLRRRNDCIAIPHDPLYRCRDRCAGRPCGRDLSGCASVDRRDTQLRRIARLFPCIGQFVCEGGRHSGRPALRACLLRCIYPRHVRGIWLRARANTSDSDYRRDVSGHPLVFVCAGLCAARLLPLLLVLSGDHISPCRAGDCCALFA